jgi:hypothetical protein
MKPIIEELEKRIIAEVEKIDREGRYRDLIDECYSFKDVGGPFAHMTPSRVLEEVDPTAFRCGVNDYGDGEGWTEVRGDDYPGDECDTIKETLIEEIEAQIDDLQTEIEEEEGQDEPDTDTIKDTEERLSVLNSQLADLKAHSF